MKKVALVLAIVLLMGTLGGCYLFGKVYEAPEKTFTYDSFSITLTKAFSADEDFETFDVCYDSKTVAVFVEKLPFADEAGLDEVSISEFAAYQYDYLKDDTSAPLAIESGIYYMNYNGTGDDNTEYTFCVSFHKGDDAFWVVQMTCDSKDYEEYKPYFLNWMKTVDVIA